MFIILDAWGTAGTILQVVGGVAVLTIAAAALVFAIKRKVAEQTIEELQALAAVRLETIAQERGDKEHAQKLLAETNEHLKECERSLNDVTREQLRINARLKNYEDCINFLERKSNLPITNFDKPFPELV